MTDADTDGISELAYSVWAEDVDDLTQLLDDVRYGTYNELDWPLPCRIDVTVSVTDKNQEPEP